MSVHSAASHVNPGRDTVFPGVRGDESAGLFDHCCISFDRTLESGDSPGYGIGRMGLVRLCNRLLISASASGGIAGIIREAITSLDRFTVGGFELNDMPIDVATASEGRQTREDFEGLLGNEVLSRFRVSEMVPGPVIRLAQALESIPSTCGNVLTSVSRNTFGVQQ